METIYRQMMSLLDNGCEGKPALMSTSTTRKPGTNELLVNGKNGIKDVPFWSSCLVAFYSWMIVLGKEGLLNAALLRLGLFSQPVGFLYTPFSILLGLLQLLAAVAPAEASQRFVDGNARQPGGERCTCGKLAQVLERPDVGILHHVFRFGVIAQDRARNTIKPLIVPAHNELIQGGIAGLHPVDDFFVGPAFGAGLFQSSGGFHGYSNYRAPTRRKVTGDGIESTACG